MLLADRVSSRHRIDPGNAAAFAIWLGQVRAFAAELHTLTFDATARKTNRQYSRTYLRERARRTFHKLGVLLTAADADGGSPPMPPAAGDPTPPTDAVTPGVPPAEVAPSQT